MRLSPEIFERENEQDRCGGKTECGESWTLSNSEKMEILMNRFQDQFKYKCKKEGVDRY